MQGPVARGTEARAQVLAERYGAPSRRGRLLVVVGAGLLAAVFGGWLAWTTWVHSTPQARSELVGYDVVDTHTATGAVVVRLADDVDPDEVTCTLRAFAWDHTTVGERTFSPAGSGRQEVDVRTEREATSVELLGCTAPDQSRPR